MPRGIQGNFRRHGDIVLGFCPLPIKMFAPPGRHKGKPGNNQPGGDIGFGAMLAAARRTLRGFVLIRKGLFRRNIFHSTAPKEHVARLQIQLPAGQRYAANIQRRLLRSSRIFRFFRLLRLNDFYAKGAHRLRNRAEHKNEGYFGPGLNIGIFGQHFQFIAQSFG